MKFEIKNRYTGAVKFTAEIECEEGASTSIKLGLAVKWAVKARADLAYADLADADLADADLAYADLADANLARANLARANLAYANLAGADLAYANLARANLARANLAYADLAGANLAGANLAYANLAGANLAYANLAGADLAYANLARANLARANLAYADLAGANLAGANLNGLSGLNGWVKCIQIEDWPITYTSEVMQIGCQRHSHDEWRGFSDAEIRTMDGMKALNFWRKWRETIFKIIEMAPALPTKPANAEASQ